MSKGTFIFVLFGVRAALSGPVFSSPVVADDGSDGGGYISDGCTTLPSHTQTQRRLSNTVITFYAVAVEEAVLPSAPSYFSFLAYFDF